MIQKTQNILLINNDYSRAGCTGKFFQGLEITLALQTHRWINSFEIFQSILKLRCKTTVL